MSARSAALYSGLVLTIGVLAARSVDHSSPSPVPTALAIPAPSATRNSDWDVIEFQLDATEHPANSIIVLGSLAEAGTVNSIRLETIPASNPGEGCVPLQGVVRESIEPRPPIPLRTARPVLDFREPSDSSTAGHSPRIFFLQLGSDPCQESSYRPVETRLAARSSRLRVWQDVTHRRRDPTPPMAWIVECLEQTILPRVAELYGEIGDLDGDGTLAICLTPRLAELPATGVPVEGLVQFNDFLPALRRPFSNHADVMFISADLQPGRHAVAILAHEAAHLAVFSRRRETDRQHPSPDEDWLNEGLAHYAEVACGGDWSNLLPRISAFHQRPALSALLVTDAQRQGLWRDPGSRGAAWSFIGWLAHEFGPEILSLIASEAGIGCGKIERAARQPFANLFRQWTLAMCQDRRDWAAKSQFQQGFLRVENFTEIALSPASAAWDIPLRGSAHAGCRVQLHPGDHVRLRVSAPLSSRLQVTVADADGQSRRYWTVR